MMSSRDLDDTKLSSLVGRTVLEAKIIGDGEVRLYFQDFLVRMFHDHGCCESVHIEDLAGDLQDLVGSPLTLSEDISNEAPSASLEPGDESYTWTFYKFATVNGYVTIRWYGTSNGYYSESVDTLQATYRKYALSRLEWGDTLDPTAIKWMAVFEPEFEDLYVSVMEGEEISDEWGEALK